MNALRIVAVSCCLTLLGACSTTPVPAPVEERAPPLAQAGEGGAVAEVPARSGYYTVKKGDTLYSIALDQGQDYKDIAGWNGLANPNVIRPGQQLRVAPPDDGTPVAVAKPVTTSGPVEVRKAPGPAVRADDATKREPKGGKRPWSEETLADARKAGESARRVEPAPAAAEKPPETAAPKPDVKPPEKPAGSDEVAWIWPATGKLLTGYSEGGSKGLDIAGKPGDPVHAAAAGTVSYAGSGLRGYGNLVVLRHSATLLSVYAHNSKILVKEKEVVASGQKIAEIGSTDAASPRLHFEIRRQGKPVDPVQYLPAR